MEQSELTKGEKMVRTTFNPSNKSEVESIKQMSASLINLVEGLKAKDPRLSALSQTYYEIACMLAVKAATAEPTSVDMEGSVCNCNCKK